MIIFENPGEMDIRMVRMFGVSAKETENPIGFFGTGLKYAVSILLRSGHEITIKSGLETYRFGTKQDQMRGKDFQFITMNDEVLPFTTELGKNWELPQAFRELYCNCLDEKGTVGSSIKGNSPRAGHTYVEVTGADFEGLYFRRDEIVLNMNKLPMVHDGIVRIFDKPASNIYYRGIAAGAMQTSSMYTYSLVDQIQLTEDRTIKSSWVVDSMIAHAVAKMKDKKHLRRILCAPAGVMENTISFVHVGSYEKFYSEEWIEVVTEEYANTNKALNSSARDIYRKMKVADLTQEYTAIELSAVEQKMLDRAVHVVRLVYPALNDYPIIVVQSLGEQVHAIAEMEGKKIVLSKSCFTLGTKYVVSTLIEEYIHLKTRKKDLTRELQTHLFDLIASLIEEHILHAPI